MERLKKYPKYKPSGIEWIGEIPEHWEVIKLKNLGKFTASGIDKKINENEPRLKIINYTDVYGNPTFILNSSRNYMEVSCSEEIKRKHQVKKGDLIFTPSSETINDIGLSALVDEDLENTAYSYHVLRFRFEKEVSHSFKKYMCNNHFVLNQFSANAKGTTRQILNREVFNNTIVILPPLPEQTAIANFLDEKTAKIDSLIEKKKKLIELYKEEKTALINQAVTRGINPNVKLKPSGIDWLGDIPEHWEVKKLKYVVQEKLKYGANEVAELEEPTFPRYIRITDFGDDGKLKDDTFRSLPPEIANDYLLNDGDILFARSGATVGKTFQFKDYKGSACFAGYLIKVSPDFYKIISDFLFLYTKSGAYENWKNSIFNQATIQNIGADKYALLNIPIPPLKEQQQIVEYIDSETKCIDDKIARAEKEIELLQEYRTALISEVVTGKIKV